MLFGVKVGHVGGRCAGWAGLFADNVLWELSAQCLPLLGRHGLFHSHHSLSVSFDSITLPTFTGLTPALEHWSLIII